jgi:hypothetical protein
VAIPHPWRSLSAGIARFKARGRPAPRQLRQALCPAPRRAPAPPSTYSGHRVGQPSRVPPHRSTCPCTCERRLKSFYAITVDLVERCRRHRKRSAGMGSHRAPSQYRSRVAVARQGRSESGGRRCSPTSPSSVDERRGSADGWLGSVVGGGLGAAHENVWLSETPSPVRVTTDVPSEPVRHRAPRSCTPLSGATANRSSGDLFVSPRPGAKMSAVSPSFSKRELARRAQPP